MTRSSQETTVISLEGVKKTRWDFELWPVDLRIEPGQVVAVVGPNGSGKSTLFGMLMNLLKPSSGELRLFGRSYPDDEIRIKRSIGYVPGVSGSSRVSQPRSCKRSSATPRSRRLSTLTATYLTRTC
jgi:ABC-type Mn2+/Zn2+ transport system ATPase subunit